MADILALSEELLVLVTEDLPRTDLRALRLVCKRISSAATRSLFRYVYVHPTKDSAEKVRNIVNDTSLSPLVNEIAFNTCMWIQTDGYGYRAPRVMPKDEDEEEDDDDEDEDDEELDDDDEDGNPSLPDLYWTAINEVSHFKNLRAVELEFEAEAYGVDNRGYHELNDKPEILTFRNDVFKALLRSLNDPANPATSVRRMCLKNVQDIVSVDIAKSKDFQKLLSKLDALQLAVTSEQDEHAPETEIERAERHTFFGNQLSTYWLKPVQNRLVELRLYANIYWGYLPKGDIYGIHFPKLKHLGLGNMTFTHDSQLEWIIRHSETLETLILDDCPIVHAAKMYCDIDADRYPIVDQNQGDLGLNGLNGPNGLTEGATWSFDARWDQWLSRFQEGLPKLRRFCMGHGDWQGDKNTISAFEGAGSLTAKIVPSRYAILDMGIGPSQWVEGPDHGNEYDCSWEEAPKFPECHQADQLALDSLLQEISKR